VEIAYSQNNSVVIAVNAVPSDVDRDVGHNMILWVIHNMVIVEAVLGVLPRDVVVPVVQLVHLVILEPDHMATVHMVDDAVIVVVDDPDDHEVDHIVHSRLHIQDVLGVDAVVVVHRDDVDLDIDHVVVVEDVREEPEHVVDTKIPVVVVLEVLAAVPGDLVVPEVVGIDVLPDLVVIDLLVPDLVVDPVLVVVVVMDSDPELMGSVPHPLVVVVASSIVPVLFSFVWPYISDK